MSNLVPVHSEAELPPLVNVEGEYALLCALLSNRQALETVADRITADDFADPFYGRFYGILVHEASAGREANPFTIRPILERDPGYEAFGGWAAVARMGGATTQLMDWRGLASDIARYARRRRTAAALVKAQGIVEDVMESEEAVVEAIDAAIGASGTAHGAETIKSAGEWARQYIDTMNDPVAHGILCSRVPGIDQALGAIRKTDLVIGAGRPGMGKTATALSYAIGAAENGNGTLLISLEMSADQLTERMIADITHESGHGVPYTFIRERDLDTFRQREVCRAAEKLNELPLHICDTAGLTVSKLDRIIRRYRRRMEARGQSLDLVIVDYLQLMSASKSYNGNRNAEVTEISNGLKQIAKSHHVGLLALSQLSREVEKRQDKRPVLSDLRDSGAIEQDADAVLFFFRLEYYLRQSEPLNPDSAEHVTWVDNLERCAGRIDFICAKRRGGEANRTRSGRFHAEYQAVR